MALQLIYDPRGHSFESWSSLMVDAYAAQQLEINVSEKNWQDFAVGLMAISNLQENAIPNPYIYKNWSDWAQELVGVVNQKVN